MFSEILVTLLDKKGIKASVLSKDTGITEAVISNWKSGRQVPKYDSLQKLSQYFGVSADYLLGLTDEPCKQSTQPLYIEKPFEPDERQQRLNDNYDKLNEAGKNELVGLSDIIAGNPTYLKADSEDNKNVS